MNVTPTAEQAESFSEQIEFDLVILDVMLSDGDGLSLARRLRQRGYQGPILMLTALSGTQDKVRGLDAGADDYLNKPVSLEALRQRVDRLLTNQAEKHRAYMLERELLTSSTFDGIVGASIPMLDLLTKVRRIAPHFSTALVTGETGTGK